MALVKVGDPRTSWCWRRATSDIMGVFASLGDLTTGVVRLPPVAFEALLVGIRNASACHDGVVRRSSRQHTGVLRVCVVCVS